MLLIIAAFVDMMSIAAAFIREVSNANVDTDRYLSDHQISYPAVIGVGSKVGTLSVYHKLQANALVTLGILR